MKPFFILAAALLSMASPALAERLYFQDFQKGSAPEWAAAGAGDVRLTAYEGNISIKIAGTARTQTEVRTSGRAGVVVRTKIAAQGLSDRDSCAAEASVDGGTHWLTVLTARHGQDSGVAFVEGAFADPRLADQAHVLIRFRADLGRSDAACWGDDVAVDGDAPTPVEDRPLNLDFLGSSAPLKGLVPLGTLFAGTTGTAPTAPVVGRLELRPNLRPDGYLPHLDLDGAKADDPRLSWPELSVDITSDGTRLVPVHGGVIASTNPEWDWVVEPGMIGMNPADGGLARAVLPVALEERNANCVHNGHLVVLFRPDGTETHAVVQFETETCAYYRFDAWSRLEARFQPAPVAQAAAAVARDRSEVSHRPSSKAVSRLAVDYPAVDLAALSRAAGPFAVFGVDDGVSHYVSDCPTRAGTDPQCAERDLPSYSTAKTLVAAQSLFRLEQMRPGTALETVAAHVPACAKAGGWSEVRLIDLLDMATGHFQSPVHELDEDAGTSFFLSTGADEKLAFACGYRKRSPAGRQFVYHTSDTFLLGAAMQDVVRRSIGQQDIYNDLVRPIWSHLDQSLTLDHTRRTYDAAAQPFTGWGLTYRRDDIVRAARFLTGPADIDGQPWLDRRLLDEALQRREPGGGLPAIFPNLRYRHGFWARNVGPLIGCRHAVWAPYMSGYGGISVVMFPNGVTFYAFNDMNHFDWAAAAPEVTKIRSLCP